MSKLTYLIILVVAVVLIRVAMRLRNRQRKNTKAAATSTSTEIVHPKRPLSPWQRKLFTVWVFYFVSLKRVFRDRVALFFTFLFPLIFLFVFGGIFGGSNKLIFSYRLD